MAKRVTQTVIESSGSRIYLSPRRNGNGLLIAQGGSHILLSDDELKILATHISDHLDASN